MPRTSPPELAELNAELHPMIAAQLFCAAAKNTQAQVIALETQIGACNGARNKFTLLVDTVDKTLDLCDIMSYGITHQYNGSEKFLCDTITNVCGAFRAMIDRSKDLIAEKNFSYSDAITIRQKLQDISDVYIALTAQHHALDFSGIRGKLSVFFKDALTIVYDTIDLQQPLETQIPYFETICGIARTMKWVYARDNTTHPNLLDTTLVSTQVLCPAYLLKLGRSDTTYWTFYHTNILTLTAETLHLSHMPQIHSDPKYLYTLGELRNNYKSSASHALHLLNNDTATTRGVDARYLNLFLQTTCNIALLEGEQELSTQLASAALGQCNTQAAGLTEKVTHAVIALTLRAMKAISQTEVLSSHTDIACAIAKYCAQHGYVLEIYDQQRDCYTTELSGLPTLPAEAHHE